MKATEYWFWKMRDDWGRVRRSVCRFTEAEALQRDPQAQRIEGTCEVRVCPETIKELAQAAPKTPPSGMPRYAPGVSIMASGSKHEFRPNRPNR